MLDSDPRRASLPCVASFVCPPPLRVAAACLLVVATTGCFGSRKIQENRPLCDSCVPGLPALRVPGLFC